VLTDWVTETKEALAFVKTLHQFGEVRKRPCQSIDLVNDDLIDHPGVDVF
jgi:hypothetical protein